MNRYFEHRLPPHKYSDELQPAVSESGTAKSLCPGTHPQGYTGNGLSSIHGAPDCFPLDEARR